MKRFMVAVVTGLFLISIGSFSMAGMLDKAVEATGKADAMAKDAKAKTDSAEQKSIEAQDASNAKSWRHDGASKRYCEGNSEREDR